MWNCNGLQGLTYGVASFWNILGLQACLQFAVITLWFNEECHVHLPFWLTCTDYRQVPCSPTCDLRTLGSTYIMPKSSLHSVPLTEISLFRNGNNPSKPSVLPFKVSAPAYLGYDQYAYILCSCLQCFSTIPKPVELNRGCFGVKKFIVNFCSSDLFIEQLLALAAECRLLKFGFRSWQEYCILSLLSSGRFCEGILINVSSKKNAFVRVFTLTMLSLSPFLNWTF